MPDWSIRIVPNPNQIADAPGAFTPQEARLGEIVSWFNTTQDKHQPWPTDSNYNPLNVDATSPAYLADPIDPGKSSDAYSLPVGVPYAVGTLYYCCKIHPKERGQITVKPVT